MEFEVGKKYRCTYSQDTNFYKEGDEFVLQNHPTWKKPVIMENHGPWVGDGGLWELVVEDEGVYSKCGQKLPEPPDPKEGTLFEFDWGGEGDPNMSGVFRFTHRKEDYYHGDFWYKSGEVTIGGFVDKKKLGEAI